MKYDISDVHLSYNKDAIMQFYKAIPFTGFSSIDEEKSAFLLEKAKVFRERLRAHGYNTYALMTSTAEKMVTSNGAYGPITPEEKYFFYVNVVDPELMALKIYECGNQIDEIKESIKRFWGIYDPNLIKIERYYNKQFTHYEDMWQDEAAMSHSMNK